MQSIVLNPQSPNPDGRERILRAATELFALHGFDGVSISDVARAAGTVKSAIYHHFVNKKALYLEVLKETCRASRAEMDAGAQGETWLARLRGAARVAGRIMGPRSHVFNLILEGMGQTAPEGGPSDGPILVELREQFTHVLAREIAAGMAAGDLKQMDPERASFCLVGLIAALLRARPADFEAQIDFALDIFLNGAMPRSFASPLAASQDMTGI